MGRELDRLAVSVVVGRCCLLLALILSLVLSLFLPLSLGLFIIQLSAIAVLLVVATLLVSLPAIRGSKDHLGAKQPGNGNNN
jgi:hypothetical protein